MNTTSPSENKVSLSMVLFQSVIVNLRLSGFVFETLGGISLIEFAIELIFRGLFAIMRTIPHHIPV